MRKLNMFIPALCLAGFSHWIKCITDKRNSNLTIQKPVLARDCKIISTATGIFKRYTLANTSYWLNIGETDEFYCGYHMNFTSLLPQLVIYPGGYPNINNFWILSSQRIAKFYLKTFFFYLKPFSFRMDAINLNQKKFL